MSVTTTSPPFPGALRAAGEALTALGADALDTLGAEALSEVARAATLAQNLTAATRLQAAFFLVESMRRIDADAHRNTHTGPGSSDPRPAHARLEPEDRARDHLCAALTLTTWHAARLVTAGMQIHTRLPRLRSVVARGMFPEQLAIDTACRLAEVPDKILPGVESEVIDALARHLDGGHRPSRTAVDGLIDGAVERRDPSAADQAVADAVDKRTVRFRPERHGMASMWANLPIADAEKLRRRIEAIARAAAEAGHPRTRHQLRADALAALGDPTTDDLGCTLYDDPTNPDTPNPSEREGGNSNSNSANSGPDSGSDSGPGSGPGPGPGPGSGSGSGEGRAGRPAPGNAWGTDQPIRISVIAAAAQGLPNRVQFVSGAYSSFEWLCEELLRGGDARFRFTLLDPTPGVLDKPDSVLKYFLTPALAERIRLRDATCRHPGCNVNAHDCDIDHIIAFDLQRPELGGPTAEWNLVCLCRKHHREKTFGHNAYRPGPLGELIIITDTGHEHRTKPTGPLAQARDQLLEHTWQQRLDHLIAEDGHLTNPPGIERPDRYATDTDTDTDTDSSYPA